MHIFCRSKGRDTSKYTAGDQLTPLTLYRSPQMHGIFLQNSLGQLLRIDPMHPDVEIVKTPYSELIFEELPSGTLLVYKQR